MTTLTDALKEAYAVAPRLPTDGVLWRQWPGEWWELVRRWGCRACPVVYSVKGKRVSGKPLTL